MIVQHPEAAMSVATPARKATNVTLSVDVLAAAKELGINISRVCDEFLRQLVKTERERQWLEQNAEFIAAYNEHVEQHGVFSDGLRSF